MEGWHKKEAVDKVNVNEGKYASKGWRLGRSLTHQGNECSNPFHDGHFSINFQYSFCIVFFSTFYIMAELLPIQD